MTFSFLGSPDRVCERRITLITTGRTALGRLGSFHEKHLSSRRGLCLCFEHGPRGLEEAAELSVLKAKCINKS